MLLESEILERTLNGTYLGIRDQHHLIIPDEVPSIKCSYDQAWEWCRENGDDLIIPCAKIVDKALRTTDIAKKFDGRVYLWTTDPFGLGDMEEMNLKMVVRTADFSTAGSSVFSNKNFLPVHAIPVK